MVEKLASAVKVGDVVVFGAYLPPVKVHRVENAGDGVVYFIGRKVGSGQAWSGGAAAKEKLNVKEGA